MIFSVPVIELEKATQMNSAELNWPSGLPRILWMRRNCPRCSSINPNRRLASSGSASGATRVIPGSLCQLLATILLVWKERSDKT